MFQMGELVFDKYKIIRLLGKGAFGQVYLAEHINLKVYRALKCIRRCPEYNGFHTREADILKNLRHPSIPIIYDIEEKDDCVCIIEEFVEGMSLKSLINNNIGITVEEIVKLTLQLCDVLGYLHSNGILHADIKPENIMYNEGRVFLLDYGNARKLGENKLPRIGTRCYAAPEAYVSDNLMESSDVYSIGVVMLFLATGKKDIEALEGIIPERFKKLVLKCLTHSEKERIKNVKELTKNLNNIIMFEAETEKISLKIGFAGAYSHCGVTHCAILAGKYYQDKKMKTVICERNYSNDFLKVLSHKDRLSFNNGVFKADGLFYVPWYYQCVNPEIEPKIDRIIYDFGTITEERFDEILECDTLCVVTGARAYEKEKTLKLLRSVSSNSNFKGEIHTLVNLANVRDYRKFIKYREIINPHRVSYHPEI